MDKNSFHFTLTAVGCALLLLLSAPVFAQEDGDIKLKTAAFLSDEERPNPVRFIADPPQPGRGPFENDTYYYHFGKAQRDTPRGAQAALDEVQWASKAFSGAAGFAISPEVSPEIFKLAEGARKANR